MSGSDPTPARIAQSMIASTKFLPFAASQSQCFAQRTSPVGRKIRDNGPNVEQSLEATWTNWKIRHSSTRRSSQIIKLNHRNSAHCTLSYKSNLCSEPRVKKKNCSIVIAMTNAPPNSLAFSSRPNAGKFTIQYLELFCEKNKQTWFNARNAC